MVRDHEGDVMAALSNKLKGPSDVELTEAKATLIVIKFAMEMVFRFFAC